MGSLVADRRAKMIELAISRRDRCKNVVARPDGYGQSAMRVRVRFWHLADVQPIASRGLVPAQKRTCLSAGVAVPPEERGSLYHEGRSKTEQHK
jgi:small-conductance mechanosensitive channel